MVDSYRDLIIWQRAVDLAVLVCHAAKKFPRTETYGLASQVQRAAVSIPSNISEGHARRCAGDFGRFLAIAAGSAAELETQLVIAKRLNYMDEALVCQLLARSDEITRMIRSLQSNVRNRR